MVIRLLPFCFQSSNVEPGEVKSVAEVQKSGVAAYMILSFLSRRINELERARMILFWFLEGGG
jgi:hypothetical protein